MKITSSSNQFIKHARALSDKKYRDEHKQFVIEGRKLLQEALANNIEVVFALLGENAEAEKMLCEKHNIQNFTVKDTLLTSLTDARCPQNIVCVCNQLPQIFDMPIGNSLVLDHLQDPGNLGAIFRCAAAFGYCDIYLIGCVDPYNEKVVRSSMGNIFKLRLHQTSVSYLTDIKQQMNMRIVVADMNGKKIDDIRLPKTNIAVIIGNEGNGVCNELMQLADDVISIPMKNNVESLNASVSAGIIMYELSKERD